MSSAHLRAVVLPEGNHRAQVREGLISLDPVPGAPTIFDGGYLVPELVDAHCRGRSPNRPLTGTAG